MILDELDRRGLKAIFFVTGWRLLGNRPEDVARRDLVRKIAAHGHLVANHSMNHHDLCQNPDKQAAEIDANSELIASTTGVRPLLFRSPYGAFCPSLAAALNARGMPDIGWNIDPQDWKTNDDEEAVLAYLIGKVDKLRGRGIMLLHDTHEASVHALPRFLDWLARENTRAARKQRPPVNIIDYSVMVPEAPRRRRADCPSWCGALYADAARLRGAAPSLIGAERGRVPDPRHRASGPRRLPARGRAPGFGQPARRSRRAGAHHRTLAAVVRRRRGAARRRSLLRVRGGSRRRPARSSGRR